MPAYEESLLCCLCVALSSAPRSGHRRVEAPPATPLVTYTGYSISVGFAYSQPQLVYTYTLSECP